MSANDLKQLRLEIEQLQLKLTLSEQGRKMFEQSIKESFNRFDVAETLTSYKDITTVIASGNDIQLDSYKSIPEFSGNRDQYRSWREQVTQRMKKIEAFKSHPKYEAALGIIRAKITNAASDILINNNTAYNIDAIIERLDFSYADKRPLYVVEAELTSIKQGGKSLQDYYDRINQALNMVITKIVMTYKNTAEQKSLIEEIQQKAIRAFIMGLKNPMIRSTLYGHTPKTLSMAFGIAQTIFYDNQFLQLDQNRDLQRIQTQMQQQNAVPRFTPPLNTGQQKNEPMDIDSSNKFKQQTNWRQPYVQQGGQKREYESGRTQQQREKLQRMNLLPEPEEAYDETVPEDLISNTSDTTETASTFLEE